MLFLFMEMLNGLIRKNYDLLISLVSASAFYLFTDIINITKTVLELKNIIHCEFSSLEMNYIQAIDKSCGCFSE
jgi:hypothetical protein